MGYTNYWTQHKDISQHDWMEIQKEVEYLMEYMGKDSAGAGTHKIEVVRNNSDHISINGIGDNAHEYFSIERQKFKDGFNCCKTNRKPYDLAVWHMLTYMRHLLGKDIEISRDR